MKRLLPLLLLFFCLQSHAQTIITRMPHLDSLVLLMPDIQAKPVLVYLKDVEGGRFVKLDSALAANFISQAKNALDSTKLAAMKRGYDSIMALLAKQNSLDSVKAGMLVHTGQITTLTAAGNLYASKDSIPVLRSAIQAAQASIGSSQSAITILQGQQAASATTINTLAPIWYADTLYNKGRRRTDSLGATIPGTINTALTSYEPISAHNSDVASKMAAYVPLTTLSNYPTTTVVNTSLGAKADTNTVKIAETNIKKVDSMQYFYYNLSGQKVYQKVNVYRGFVVPTTGNNFTINIAALGLTAITSYQVTYVHPVTVMADISNMTALPPTTTSLRFYFTSPVALNVTVLPIAYLPIGYTTNFTDSGVWITFSAY